MSNKDILYNLLQEDIKQSDLTYDEFRNTTEYLGKQLYGKDYRLNYFEMFDESGRIDFKYKMFISNRTIYSINDNGKIQGYILFNEIVDKSKNLTIDIAYVFKEYAGKGIAQKILQYARNVLKKQVKHSNSLTDKGAHFAYNDIVQHAKKVQADVYSQINDKYKKKLKQQKITSFNQLKKYILDKLKYIKNKANIQSQYPLQVKFINRIIALNANKSFIYTLVKFIVQLQNSNRDYILFDRNDIKSLLKKNPQLLNKIKANANKNKDVKDIYIALNIKYPKN